MSTKKSKHKTVTYKHSCKDFKSLKSNIKACQTSRKKCYLNFMQKEMISVLIRGEFVYKL